MSLRNDYDLLLKVKKVLKKRICKKPNVITNPILKDILIENDLCGFNIYDIQDLNKIRLLSSDISTFNDEAYRFYIIQFIEQFYQNNEAIFLTMFLQSFFESNSLSLNTKRYLQFSVDEVEIIIDFLKYPFDNNDFSTEIQQAILFWKKHPSLKK